MDYRDIINGVISREGGYNNDPKDRGGPTKYGITQKTLAAYKGRPVSVEEVKNLTVELAFEIYERRFYREPGFDSLPEEIQAQVVDIGVMSGPRTATRMLQQVVNLAHFGPVEEDGVMGPKTRAAVTKAVSEMGNYFTNGLVDQRKNFYETIIADDPSQERFRKGWMSRAEKFRVEIV